MLLPRRSLIPLALAVVVALSACGADAGAPDAAEPTGAPALAAPADGGGGGLVLVLPPADLLAAPARAALRRLVDTTVEEHAGSAVWEVLEPATAASLADTIEIAVRRAGGDGTVCVVGARGRSALAAVLARYPASRTCVVPGPVPTGVAPERAAVGDVDLVRLGREAGAAARSAAGEGAVLLVDGGDGLLDVRWRRGVEEGVLGAPGASGPTLGVVASAVEALALLDAQAALLAEGIIPGGPDAVAPGGDGAGLPDARDGLPPGDLLPTARSLLPVSVVVLDAGPESAALAVALDERGIDVVVPTSFLRADLVRVEQVVAHWRVRWDAPLGVALAGGAAEDALLLVDPVVLVPGPAGTRP